MKRRSRFFAAALVFTFAALLITAGASAATVRAAITGSYTVAPVPADPNPIAVDVALSGVVGDLVYTGIGSSAGSLTVNFPVFPFAGATGPGAGLTEFHGDVSQGCVRIFGNRAIVIGHLPANEQFDINTPTFVGHMEWVGTHVDDNGVGTAVDRGRVFVSRTQSGINTCNPALTPDLLPVFPLSAGDAGIGYTDQLDAFPSNPDTGVSVVDPNGLSVAVTDEPDGATGEGLNVAVGAGSGSAELLACGLTTNVSAGSTVIATCASLILEVVTGSAEVVLGGGLAVVSIPEGGVAEITEEADGSFTVENQGPTPIEVTVDGETDTIEPGETDAVEAWDFEGFTGLDAAPALNNAKAGSSVPLKWRVVDAAGAPVTDLSAATITVTDVDGTTGADLGNTQPGQTAGSLQNLGNGNYQLNWKTQKSWGGTCKAAHLDIGDGVTHDAYFKFK